MRRLLFALLLGASPFAAADSVIGVWRVVSWTGGQPDFTQIEIARTGDGYEVVVDGKRFSGYYGDDRSISHQYAYTLDELRREFDRAPDAVLEQALGRIVHRLTLTLGADGRLVDRSNVVNIKWTGEHLDAIEPDWSSTSVTYERIGGAAAPQGIRIGALETNVFTCSLANPATSGCLEVRNDSDRRVRLRFDGTPGVACTADPHVWCGVALAVGEYAIRIVADDEQGVGPELAGRITVSTTGTRIRIVGE